jgi:hypothetical protein
MKRSVLLCSFTAASAFAADTSFVQTWSAMDDLEGWDSQAKLSNPGDGGVDGAGDGFLIFARTIEQGALGANARDPKLNEAFLGDYLAKGVTEIRAWFRNLGDTEIEIHVGIADSKFGAGGRYMSLQGATLPIGGDWTQVSFDFSEDNFVYHGFEPEPPTFTETAQSVISLHFRHDMKPIGFAPIPTEGEVGVDNVQLISGNDKPTPGDSDGNGDVDLVDFAEFQLCFTGPSGTVAKDCAVMDFDDDGDVDLADFGSFQLAFTGSM